MRGKGKGNAGWRLAGFAVLAALAARGLFLLIRPVWFDELYTLWIARKPAGGILEALRSDSGPPLFYLLEVPVVRFAELLRFDPAARLLSFAAAGLLFAFNRRKRWSAGGSFACLLAACPLIFFHSGEARAYALLSLASFGLFLAVYRARPGARSLAAAAALAAALPLIHYLGGLVVAGSALTCAARRKWNALAAQIVGACVFLAWLPVARAQPAGSLAWGRESLVSSGIASLEKAGFWGSAPSYFAAAAVPVPAAGAVLGLLLLAGTAAAARKDRACREALIFAILPLVFAALAGLWRPIYFSGRTEMAVLPVLLWAVARASRKSAVVRPLAFLACAAGAVSIASALASPPRTPPYAATARFVSERSRPGDLAVAGGADYLPLALDADRGGLPGRLVGLPAEIESHPGWFEPGKIPRPDAEKARMRTAAASVDAGGSIRIALPPDPALVSLVSGTFAGRSSRVFRPPGGDMVIEIERAARGPSARGDAGQGPRGARRPPGMSK